MKNLKLFSFASLLFFSASFFSYAEVPSDHPGAEDYHQAAALIQEGSLDEAEDAFKKALVLEPTNPEYHFELANLYAMQQDESEKVGDTLGADHKMNLAEGELKQAVMSRPGFLPAHFNLGVVYKKLGKYEEARKEFKEVLLLDPSQVSAQMQIAATYEAQGFYDEAETLYKEVNDQYPGSGQVQEALMGVNQRRARALEEERSARGARMNSLNGILPGLSQNAQNQNAMYGNGSQQSAGMGQAVPFLGQWALQQFMKRKSPSGNNTSADYS